MASLKAFSAAPTGASTRRISRARSVSVRAIGVSVRVVSVCFACRSDFCCCVIADCALANAVRADGEGRRGYAHGGRRRAARRDAGVAHLRSLDEPGVARQPSRVDEENQGEPRRIVTRAARVVLRRPGRFVSVLVSANREGRAGNRRAQTPIRRRLSVLLFAELSL